MTRPYQQLCCRPATICLLCMYCVQPHAPDVQPQLALTAYPRGLLSTYPRPSLHTSVATLRSIPTFCIPQQHSHFLHAPEAFPHSAYQRSIPIPCIPQQQSHSLHTPAAYLEAAHWLANGLVDDAHLLANLLDLLQCGVNVLYLHLLWGEEGGGKQGGRGRGGAGCHWLGVCSRRGWRAGVDGQHDGRASQCSLSSSPVWAGKGGGGQGDKEGGQGAGVVGWRRLRRHRMRGVGWEIEGVGSRAAVEGSNQRGPQVACPCLVC